MENKNKFYFLPQNSLFYLGKVRRESHQRTVELFLVFFHGLYFLLQVGCISNRIISCIVQRGLTFNLKKIFFNALHIAFVTLPIHGHLQTHKNQNSILSFEIFFLVHFSEATIGASISQQIFFSSLMYFFLFSLALVFIFSNV